MIRRPPRSPLFPSTTLSRSPPSLGLSRRPPQPVPARPARAPADRGAAQGGQGHAPAQPPLARPDQEAEDLRDRKSTRLNSSHSQISYAVFCLKKKNTSQH